MPSLRSDAFANKVIEFNSQLADWCNANGVVLIETVNYFKLGTGDVDLNCYENNDKNGPDYLSRGGAIRLLDAIVSVCREDFNCHNWMEVKQNFVEFQNGRGNS